MSSRTQARRRHLDRQYIWNGVEKGRRDLGGNYYTKPESDARYGRLDFDNTWTGLNTFDSIQWDLTPTAAVGPQEGLMQWNADDGTLNLGMPGGNVNLQIGQEVLLRVRATEALSNGQAVYISGATGANPLASLADADSLSTALVIGIATEDIASDQFGYVTTFGLVRDLNLAGCTEGDTLWLGQTPGEVTNVRPTQPAFGIVVGICLRAHATEGVMLAKVDIIPRLVSLSDVSISSPVDASMISWDDTNGVWVSDTSNVDRRDPIGFENRTDSTMAFNEGTREFTLTGTYDVWCAGVRKTFTGESYTVPDVDGVTYLYYDETGTFTQSATPWTFGDDAPVCQILWDATNNKGIAWEERHGSVMSWATHQRLHDIDGTQAEPGSFNIGGFTTAPSSPVDSDNTFTLSDGELHDEDIEQDHLSFPGTSYSHIHREGAAGALRITTGSTVPVLEGGSYLYWNEFTGSTWQLTASSNNRYVNYYLFKVTALDGTYQQILIPGQAEYTTLSDAEAESVGSLSLLSFASAEVAPIYKITFGTSAAYSTTGKCRIESVARLGGSRSELAGVSPVTDHQSLSGREGPDAHPATAIATDTTNFAGVLSTADTNVQLALDTIDDLLATANTWTALQTFSTATVSGDFTLNGDVYGGIDLVTGGLRTRNAWSGSTFGLFGLGASTVYVDVDSGSQGGYRWLVGNNSYYVAETIGVDWRLYDDINNLNVMYYAESTETLDLRTDVEVDGTLNVNDTTQANGAGSAALVVVGGFECGKDGHILGDLYLGSQTLAEGGTNVLELRSNNASSAFLRLFTSGSTSLSYIGATTSRNFIVTKRDGSSNVWDVDNSGNVTNTGDLTVLEDVDVTGQVTIGDVLSLTGSTSDPTSPTDGTIWHRTDTDEIRVRLNGTTYSIDVTAV